jgi:alkylhydroperoxidase family enzyme
LNSPDLDRQPTADNFEQLRRHFDENAIIELTGLIAFQNMSSKFNAAMDIEPQGFCTLPLREKQAGSD